MDREPDLGDPETGLAVAQVCRKHGLSSVTYYQWNSKYAGMSANALKEQAVANSGYWHLLHSSA